MPTFMIASSRGGRVRTMPDPLVHDLIFSSVAAAANVGILAFQTSIVHVCHSTSLPALHCIPITIIASFDTATVRNVND